MPIIYPDLRLDYKVATRPNIPTDCFRSLRYFIVGPIIQSDVPHINRNLQIASGFSKLRGLFEVARHSSLVVIAADPEWRRPVSKYLRDGFP
jgi:hypothetical protein